MARRSTRSAGVSGLASGSQQHRNLHRRLYRFSTRVNARSISENRGGGSSAGAAALVVNILQRCPREKCPPDARVNDVCFIEPDCGPRGTRVNVPHWNSRRILLYVGTALNRDTVGLWRGLPGWHVFPRPVAMGSHPIQSTAPNGQ